MNKPNIILLTLDQLRQDTMLQFNEFRELKKKGVLFSQMITYAPYTVASLHALFSGMYGTQNGVDSYYGSLDFDKDNCFTLAQYLKENGYYTKADIFSKILFPHQGFDECLIYDEYKDNLKIRHKKEIKETVRHKPFFLCLHYGNIHTGIVVEVARKFGDFDEEYFSNYEQNKKRYEGFANAAVDYFREIMEFCSEQNLMENTLFIIMTDHGCSLGEKRGEKCYGVYVYDYTVLTFAYFLYPAILPKNIEIKKLIRSIDITPTILDIIGIKQKAGFKKMQGQSLLPLILGKDEEDREAYIETAGLEGPNPSPYKPNICAYRTNEWKLIYNEATGQKELYNLKNDPKENINLIGQYPEIEDELWIKIKENGSKIFRK